MTREEAIMLLKQWNPIHPSKKEAVEVAVEALRQPQIVHCPDCLYNKNCISTENGIEPDGFCKWGERKGAKS